MIQSKIELKLLKILDLLHEEKINILDNKQVLYSNIQKIHSRVEVIYDSIKTSKGREIENLSSSVRTYINKENK